MGMVRSTGDYSNDQAGFIIEGITEGLFHHFLVHSSQVQQYYHKEIILCYINEVIVARILHVSFYISSYLLNNTTCVVTFDFFLNTIVITLVVVKIIFHFTSTLWVIEKNDSINKIYFIIGLISLSLIITIT